jgi:hypothetical protein
MWSLPEAAVSGYRRVTYFRTKMCSRYILLGICCASMVKYKICRLLEHRLKGLLQERMRQPYCIFGGKVKFFYLSADIIYGKVCPIGGAV